MNKNVAIRPAIGTGLLLLVPLVFTLVDRNQPAGTGWHWEPPDFVVMGTLLFGAGLCYELIAHRLATRPQRLLLAMAVLAVVLAIWIELAVRGISQLLGWVLG